MAKLKSPFPTPRIPADSGIPLPLERFFHWENYDPEGVFVIEYDERGSKTELTWQQAAKQVRSIAGYLVAQGVEAGDRIGIFMPPGARWILVDLAIWFVGAVSVVLSPDAHSSVRIKSLISSGVKHFFIDPGALDEPLPKDWFVTGVILPTASSSASNSNADYKVTGWETLIEFPVADSWRLPTEHVHLAPATVIYTAGTASDAKAVVHGFGSLAYCATQLAIMFDVHRVDRLLLSGSMCQPLQRLFSELVAIYQGCTLVTGLTQHNQALLLVESKPSILFGLPDFWRLVRVQSRARQASKIRQWLLRVPFLNQLLRRKILKQLGLDNLRFAITGGALLPLELEAWFATIGVEFVKMYGLSENLGYSHSTLHYQGSKTGSLKTLGLPNPGVESQISEGQELLTRSPANMWGFYDDQERSLAAFDDNGFLRTGDLVALDMDHQLILKGRIDDSFLSSRDRLITPFVIETKLSALSQIKQSWVTGNALMQPMALVVLNDRNSVAPEVLEDQLRWLNDQLNPHEKIRRLVVVKDEWNLDNDLVGANGCLKRASLAVEYELRIERWTENPEAVIWE